MTDEERASFIWGGTRARPRKGIERVLKSNETFLKPPGSCQTKFTGQSVGVEIECCEKCSIYVLDPCEQVQVSECINCRIVVGPCVGSVLVFDCIDCTIAVAGKQVRLRDCQNCELRTYGRRASASSSRRPRSNSLLERGLPGLASQFAAVADWDETNFWDKIFDFSPATGNWTKLPSIDAGGGGAS